MTYSGYYDYIKILPLLVIFNFKKLVLKDIIIIAYLIISLLYTSNYDLLILLLPLFLLVIFKKAFYEISFTDIIEKTKIFFYIAILYGGYQFTFGYLPHEVLWISSGMSIVNESNMFIDNSLYAHFQYLLQCLNFLFSFVYTHIDLLKQNVLGLMFCLIGF